MGRHQAKHSHPPSAARRRATERQSPAAPAEGSPPLSETALAVETVRLYEWPSVFDQIPEPIFIHDKHFRILRCNAAYAAHAQLPIAEIIGKPYWQIFPKTGSAPTTEPESGEPVCGKRSEFTTDAGQVFLTHDITAHRDSGEFWYSSHVMEDITARRRHEEQEKLKSSFSDAIIGSAPGMFLVVDRKHRLVRWNAELNTLSGRNDAELVGTPLPSLVAEAHRELLAATLERAFAEGVAQGELGWNGQCGHSNRYVCSARRFGAAGEEYVASFWIEQTEVKQLEHDLLREKTVLNTIIESAPGAFFMIDEAGMLVRWNNYLREETGLSDDELRGRSILSAIHEDDRPLAAAKILAAFATGYTQMEVRVPTKDHGVRCFLKTARRLVFDGVPYVAGFCFDVTDRKQTEDALRREKEFSDALIESVPGAFYVVDREGNYVRWNSYLNRLTGLSDRQLDHHLSLLSIAEEDRPLAATTMKHAFETGYGQAELHVLTRERGVRLYLMNARRFAVGDTPYLVGVGIDTTEWLARMAELEHDSQTDPLTQVANRGYFLEKARQEFARCRRYGHPLSLWMLDVDHFKNVNDTFGHHAGDVALQSLVQISQQALRDPDIIGRMGGEEFAVLLPETESTQALMVAERFRQAISTTAVPLEGGQSVRLTVSIGIATVHDDDAELEALLDRADQALYEAKRTGRDKVRLEAMPA